MELADFAVAIEEMLSDECSHYECVVVDKNKIGMVWSFMFEETVSGYLNLESDISALTIGLHIRDITNFTREEIFSILEKNAELISANFSAVRVPAKNCKEDISGFVGEDDDMIMEDEELFREHLDILTIQMRIPLDAFSADDFFELIQALLFQSEELLGKESDDELKDFDDELDEEPDSKSLDLDTLISIIQGVPEQYTEQEKSSEKKKPLVFPKPAKPAKPAKPDKRGSQDKTAKPAKKPGKKK